MIRLKSLLSEETAKTYTTKKSWTLKGYKNTKSYNWDVLLQIPAGTVWKQIYQPTTEYSIIIESTTPLLIKLSLRKDPSVYKYTKQQVKALYKRHGGEWSPHFHIFIPVSPELFPPEYSAELNVGMLGGHDVLAHIDIDPDDTPGSADLFSNLEHTFVR